MQQSGGGDEGGSREVCENKAGWGHLSQRGKSLGRQISPRDSSICCTSDARSSTCDIRRMEKNKKKCDDDEQRWKTGSRMSRQEVEGGGAVDGGNEDGGERGRMKDRGGGGGGKMSRDR